MVKIALPKISFGFFKKKSFLVSFGVGLVIICLLAAGSYFAYQYFSLKTSVQDPTKAIMRELEYVVGKVGKLVELPKDETPLLATVDDVNKLKDKPFFKNAMNGDKALFYTKAQKAILYRPETNKIIEIGPYIVPSITPTPPVFESTSAGVLGTNSDPVAVAILNGTSVSGLARTAEEKLISKIKNIEIVEKKDANKKDYTKNIIIDVKGNQSQLVGEIQSILGGEASSSLPVGEATPEGSIVIILGSNI